MKTITKITMLLCALIGTASILPAASAEEIKGMGTIIIEQKNTMRLGEWGLSTPIGPVEGKEALYEDIRTEGPYSLTVDPPAGAVPTITVIEGSSGSTVFENSRTVVGMLGSGSSLKFEISYAFTLVGTVNITSHPQGIQFRMVGPRQQETGVTPASFENVPEGPYTVYFDPTECPPPRPFSRELRRDERITFDYNMQCNSASSQSSSSSSQQSSASSEPEPEPQPEPERVDLRTAISTSTREITAKGSVRYTVRIANTGEAALTNLTAQVRYDASQITIDGARSAQQSAGTLTWEIDTLPARGTWENTFSGAPKDGVKSGAKIITSLAVNGAQLAGIPNQKRTDSVQVAVIGAASMPKTGVPNDLILALFTAFIATAFGSMTIARKYAEGRL